LQANPLALLRKSLIVNGAGEGNRTLISGIVVYSGIKPLILLDILALVQ
jgi:hypothetical protein